MKRLSTRLVHAGEPLVEGAVAAPIFQSATYLEQPGLAYDQIRYGRLNTTPAHDAIHAKLAAVCESEAALVTASGMAAISATLLSQLSAGDHLIAQRGLYGGTHALFANFLPRLGIDVSFVDADDASSWAAALRPATRLFYCEALANPLLEVGDLEGIVAFCREHGLTSVVDATFAGPVLFRPAALGFDLEVHSATKTLNGHSDLCAGLVAGRQSLVDDARKATNLLGGSLDPHAIWMLQRGLKTLSLRVRAQCEGAMALATLLSAHPSVARVNYPGLAEHPQHDRAARLFDGFGTMISFELAGGASAADALVERLEIPLLAPSLGGPETLITLPARSSHAGLTPEERAAAGVSDGLVRVSVGIEAAEDLTADFRQALR